MTCGKLFCSSPALKQHYVSTHFRNRIKDLVREREMDNVSCQTCNIVFTPSCKDTRAWRHYGYKHDLLLEVCSGEITEQMRRLWENMRQHKSVNKKRRTSPNEMEQAVGACSVILRRL